MYTAALAPPSTEAVTEAVTEATSSEPSRPSASIFCGALLEFRRSSGGGSAPSVGGGEAGEERGRLCWLCRISRLSAFVGRLG